MSRNIRIGSKSKNKFKKTIQGVIKDLSREIIVYSKDLRSECSNCYYDKVNDKSSGIPKSSPGDLYYFTTGRCPVCYGKGVITTSRKRTIKGLVIWNPQGDRLNALAFTEAGTGGATRVEIKTDPVYLDLIKNCKHVMIDNIMCKLANPPIIRGLGNKSLLIGEFFTDAKSKASSGERL